MSDPEQLFLQGETAFDSKNYSEALTLFQKAASLGHVQSTYQLGICHLYGKGVIQNRIEGAKWFKLYSNLQSETNLNSEQIFLSLLQNFMADPDYLPLLTVCSTHNILDPVDYLCALKCYAAAF